MKYSYKDYARDGETKVPLPDDIIELKKQIHEIGAKIRELSAKDEGWKGGIKTTSYDYSFGNLKWSGWDGDCESMRILFNNKKKIATAYDCYGQGWVEFTSKDDIRKIYNRICK